MSTLASKAPLEDTRRGEHWLVRVGPHVVGPMSLDQIERGVVERRIPVEADMAHIDHGRWSPVADLVPLSVRPGDDDGRRRISGVQPTFAWRGGAPAQAATARASVPGVALDTPSFPEDSIEIPKHGWLKSLFG